MTERLATSGATSGVEAEFARLVAEITSKLQAGQAIDLELLAADVPEHIDRLRQLLPTLVAMAQIGCEALDARMQAAPPVEDEGPKGTLGDFRIVREIGRGGMGIVYEAEQLSLARRVALKVLPFASMLDPRQLARFRNEARRRRGAPCASISISAPPPRKGKRGRPATSVGCFRPSARAGTSPANTSRAS